MPIYVLKSNTIPQMQSSLTSIFSLEIDPREAAMRETEDAIEAVLQSSEAVELSPQNAYIRRLQHQLAERANLVSRSRGPRAVSTGQAVPGRRDAGDDRSALRGVDVAARVRDGLRRLGTGLIVYGAVGLIVAAIGFGAVVWVNDRVGAFARRPMPPSPRRRRRCGLAASVLRDASTTAQSFTVTLEQSTLAVASAAGTITELQLGPGGPGDATALGQHPGCDAAFVVGRRRGPDRHEHRGTRHAALADRRQLAGQSDRAGGERRRRSTSSPTPPRRSPTRHALGRTRRTRWARSSGSRPSRWSCSPPGRRCRRSEPWSSGSGCGASSAGRGPPDRSVVCTAVADLGVSSGVRPCWQVVDTGDLDRDV